MEEFKIPNWHKLNIETAKFIYDEAEKNLKEHLETAKLITTRAQTIIGFVLPTLIVLIGYIFSQVVNNKIDGWEFYIPFGISIVLGLIVVISFDAYWIYRGKPLGNEPMNIIRDDKIESPKQQLAFIVTAIKSLQRRIKDNEQENKNRANKLESLFKVFIGILVVGIIANLLLFFQII